MKNSGYCRKKDGYTLIELMIVVAVIGIIASIASQKFGELINKAKAAAMIQQMTSFAAGVRLYRYSNEEYPLDNHRECPPGMELYINKYKFNENRPFNGYWNYEGPDYYGWVGIAIDTPDVSENLLMMMDKMMDDGNLYSGQLRYNWGPGTAAKLRYTYVIEYGVNPPNPAWPGWTTP